MGLLAGTVVVAGVAGSFFPRDERSGSLSVTVELISSTTKRGKTSDVMHPVLRASPWAARSPDGKILAVSDTSHVALWNVRSGRADPASRRTLPATLARFTFVTNDILAVAQTGDAMIQFWSVGRVPVVVQTYVGPVGREVSLAAGRDGTLTVVQVGIEQTMTQILRISIS